MSDGDGKDSVKFLSEKENQQSKRRKMKVGADEFVQAIARIAVAQICESVGFQSFQQSALDSLADVGVRHIREIGISACYYANLANRSQCNVFDVIQGLEDLGSVQGFAGASDVNHALSGSGVVRDIIHYVGKEEEVPFAYSIPVFPVVKERTLDPSFAQANENPPDEHIPSWLPKFPDPKTYTDLSSGNEKDSETEVVNKIQQVEEQHRKVERPLPNVQKKLTFNGSEAGAFSDQGDATKAQRAAENNPFLAPPFQSGEKEVFLPVLPAKLLDEAVGYHQSCEVTENHRLTLEPSLQSNEAVRSGHSESEEKRQIRLDGRSNVQFKLGNAKKSLGMVRSAQNESIKRISLWFDDDYDAQDEKKGGAETILWENTEDEPKASHL
ncbi:putative bromodomain transcription factor [Handroanthus impetiginosus]|uniref:Transcription initiation factor TFIID subunit 8 n=1 Tax=Handroanthus impetiginosus TaxID=429701 RepID=A0A2G9FXT7_9LAMI|nr:putative bromodomain transcription factor [Handroanthus impetiginosus]